MSTTEQASVVVEQSEVASGRSIRGGSFRQTNDNNNFNPNERPLRTTGFAFKARNSFGGQTNGVDGQTSPIPFIIPSYASGIIFRNSDNDKSPQVEIQPAIDVASKTIGPEEESAAAASNGRRDFDSTTTSTFKRITPTTNVNLVNSFERKTFAPPLQTTSFFKTSTVTQASIAQNEIQNISPIQTVSTTLSPFAPSQINTMPTIDKTTSEPRFSDITKRIEILGLQAPGYAIRNDGTIDSEAIPPNFVINTNTNFASNNLNPLDFDASAAAASATTQMTHTTTPRVTRTTQHQHFLPTQFIPSNDNPFLPHRKSKQNLNATPAPFNSFKSSTKTNTFKGFTTFATNTQSAQFSTVNNNNRNNQHAIGNGFASFAPQTSTNPSPFSKNGINQNSPNQANGQFGNQLNSRQSKNYNELSFNAQQQAQRKNQPQIVLNLDNRARLPPFGIAETTTTFPASSSFGASTTKRVQSFANSAIPTAKAPAGFSFAAFAKTSTTKPTPRTRIVPTTNVPTTFSTIFPSKYTFITIPTTVSPFVAQSNESLSLDTAEPSIELLPPVSSNTADAKSAFAPINEAGALIRSKSPAFSAGATNRNQQQQQPSNGIKPFNANNSPPKVNNGFTAFPITTTRTTTKKATVTTKSPIRYRPAFTTTTFKFTTTTRTPTATAAETAINTTPFAPNAKAQAPYTDLLPPIELDSQTKESSFIPSTNAFEQSSISLPNNDLLPPLSFDAQTQNLQSSNAPSTNSILRTSNADDASVAAAGVVRATTTTTGTKAEQQQNSDQDTELDLNPFLPPVDSISKSPTATNAESNSEKNNEYTTITLEQNPFLPQLDLNPFLPPFIFSPSENDQGFGFGAGTPPKPADSDETPAPSNIVTQSTNAPLKFRFKRSSENRGQLRQQY